MSYSPGIYDGIKNAAYHADPALGSTSLKTLATKTPAHYQHGLKHPKTSTAFDLGTAAHSLILEGDESGVVVIDVDSKRGKAWTDPASAAEAEGKIALTSKEWAQVVGMRDSVMAHDVAGPLLTGHKAEQSVFWDEGGQTLKCRPDAWQPNVLVDLKTTIDANPNEFGKVAHNLGYHQSAAHYMDGVKVATGEELPFKFVLVEKAPPYLVSVVELDFEAIDIGRGLNDRAKRIYRECMESGNWPGYPATEPVRIPQWAVYQAEDLLGIDNEIRF